MGKWDFVDVGIYIPLFIHLLKHLLSKSSHYTHISSSPSLYTRTLYTVMLEDIISTSYLFYQLVVVLF